MIRGSLENTANRQQMTEGTRGPCNYKSKAYHTGFTLVKTVRNNPLFESFISHEGGIAYGRHVACYLARLPGCCLGPSW